MTCLTCGDDTTLCDHNLCPSCCDLHWEPDPDLVWKGAIEHRMEREG